MKAFFGRLFGYLAITLIESSMALLLAMLVVSTGIFVGAGDYSFGTFITSMWCAGIILAVMAPALLGIGAGIFLVIKVLYVVVPPARRGWNHVFNWLVAAGLLGTMAQKLARESSRNEVIFIVALCIVPSVTLTISHFWLMPRFDPKARVRDYLRPSRLPAPPPPAA